MALQADPVMILNDDNAVVVKSNRMQEGGVPQLEPGMVVGQLTLADALIVGNCNSQVYCRDCYLVHFMHSNMTTHTVLICILYDQMFVDT